MLAEDSMRVLRPVVKAVPTVVIPPWKAVVPVVDVPVCEVVFGGRGGRGGLGVGDDVVVGDPVGTPV